MPLLPTCHVIEHKGPHYITLPENVSDINDFICRPLNRKGRVCSECMEGYGPALMSEGFDIRCSNCTGAWYGIASYYYFWLWNFSKSHFLFCNPYIPGRSTSLQVLSWGRDLYMICTLRAASLVPDPSLPVILVFICDQSLICRV